MKEHKDYYLIVSLGEVIAKSFDFNKALEKAKKLAKELDLNVTIDAVEQISVSTIHPTGHVFGRIEESN